MQLRLLLAIPLLAAATLAQPATRASAQSPPKSAGAAHLPQSQQVRNLSPRILGKLVPGHSTKAEVEAVLGKPWRDTRLTADTVPYKGDPSVDIWEFRGRDSHGTYRVHIEFDAHDISTLVAKIPDKAARATARVSAEVSGK